MTAESFYEKQSSSEYQIWVKMTALTLKLLLMTAYMIKYYITSEENVEDNYVSASLRSFFLTSQPPLIFSEILKVKS